MFDHLVRPPPPPPPPLLPRGRIVFRCLLRNDTLLSLVFFIKLSEKTLLQAVELLKINGRLTRFNFSGEMNT